MAPPPPGWRWRARCASSRADRLASQPGYRFGLADEEPRPASAPLPPARTDAAGQASLPLELPVLPAGSRPNIAKVEVRVLEDGGRPVERTLERPVQDTQARLGLKPLFEGAVDEGGKAAFEVIAIAPNGQRLAQRGLRWTLSRVTTSFQWFQSDGRWDYEPVSRRERVASGDLDLGTGAPARIEAPVAWGGYELAVAPAPAAKAGPTGSGAGTGPVPVSLAFEAGWYLAPKAIDTPDLLKVSLDKPGYQVGDTARARIEARFPGTALVLALGDRLLTMQEVQVPAEGLTVELPVTADWGAGAYVTALLYRPMDLAAKRMPGRAIGLAWAGVAPGERKLQVAVTPLGPVAPRQPLNLEVAVPNLQPGEEAYVTLAAVDVGILNLTRFTAPDPDAWYFGQRRLGMEIRDLYGQLIDRMQGAPGVVRSGGDSGLVRLQGPPPTEDLVAFHSGILRLDAQGKARVSFAPSDFNGTIKLMAMAWTAAGVGHGAQDLMMRDPIVIQASLPRFLAPGDSSRVLIELTHVSGPVGRVVLGLEAEGGLIELDAQAARRELDLGAGGRARSEVPVRALAVGDAGLRVRLKTPDGQEIVKPLRLPVRDYRPPQRQTRVETLKPGGRGLVLTQDLLKDLQPDSGTLLLSASGAGRLDLPGLLQSLDRYPFGCAEQITSRALPLLYLNQIALAAGLSGEREAGPRIKEAIADLIGKQGSDGGFGLWGPGGDDLWLDAYVTDFLTRARESGHAVPEVAFQLALDKLRNRLAYAGDLGGGTGGASAYGEGGDDRGDAGGEDLAYALYVLARNARAVIGDLRYYAEAKLDAFATPMARAQLGAALALYGDKPRADRAFASALALLNEGEAGLGWRLDFGSSLRDAAALLALAAESGTGAIDLNALAARIDKLGALDGRLSTQEQAWLLLAAQALMEGAAKPRLELNGQPSEGPLFRRFEAKALAAAPATLVNRGKQPIEVLVTLSGIPRLAPPAGGQGYRIERAYYDPEGKRVQPDTADPGPAPGGPRHGDRRPGRRGAPAR